MWRKNPGFEVLKKTAWMRSSWILIRSRWRYLETFQCSSPIGSCWLGAAHRRCRNSTVRLTHTWVTHTWVTHTWEQSRGREPRSAAGQNENDWECAAMETLSVIALCLLWTGTAGQYKIFLSISTHESVIFFLFKKCISAVPQPWYLWHISYFNYNVVWLLNNNDTQ